MQVILAMDEGQYEGKVDVWSLGITCIGTSHLIRSTIQIADQDWESGLSLRS